MPEEKVVDAVKPESPVGDSVSLIERAEKAAADLKAGNEELAKLLFEQQKIALKNTFDGKARAGNVEKSQDEKEIEEARKMLEGTGLEDYAFPPQKK